MDEFVERTVGALRIRIDRTLCVGFADCISEAPEGFRLDEQDMAVFGEDPGAVERDRMVRACDLCPVDALTVWDEDGQQLVP